MKNASFYLQKLSRRGKPSSCQEKCENGLKSCLLAEDVPQRGLENLIKTTLMIHESRVINE